MERRWCTSELVLVVMMVSLCGVVASLPRVAAGGAAPPAPIALYVGGLFPLSEDGGRQRGTAFLMALDEINRNQTILPNTRLIPLLNDTNRSTQNTVIESLEMIVRAQEDGIPLGGIIGAASSSTSIVAQVIASSYEILQISPSATSPWLSNKQIYPSFLRVVASDVLQAQALVDISRHFGWSEAGFVHIDDEYGNEGFAFYTKYLAENVIMTLIEAKIDPDDLNCTGVLQHLQQFHLDVVILYAVVDQARAFYLQAVEMGLQGKYGFLVSDGCASEGVYKSDNPEEDALIAKFIDGTVGLKPRTSVADGYWQFVERWKALNETEYAGAGSDSFDFYVPYSYDSTYLLALTLDSYYKQPNRSADVALVASDLLPIALQLQFEGASGTVALDESGDRDSLSLTVVNFVNGSFVDVGTWDSEDGFAVHDNSSIAWYNGSVEAPKGLLRELHIGGFFEYHADLSSDSAIGFLAGSDSVNARDDILPYTELVPLTHRIEAGSISVFVGMSEFVSQKVLGVVGAAQSTIADTTSLIAAVHDLPQISFFSSLSSLGSTELFPTFLRIVPPNTQQVLALQRFVDYFHWHRFGLLVSADEYCQSGAQDLFYVFGRRSDFHCTFESVDFDDETMMRDVLSNWVKEDLKIILVFARSEEYRKVIPIANENEMLGDGYAWILCDSAGSPTLFEDDFGLEIPYLRTKFQGFIATMPSLGSNRSAFDEFWKDTVVPRYPEAHVNYDTYAPFSFDAAVALAVACHSVLESHTQLDRDVFLEDLRNVSFLGVTGPIAFDQYGDGIPRFDFLNLRGSRWEQVGTWLGTPSAKPLDDDAASSIDLYAGIVWPGGDSNPPLDHTPCKLEIMPVWLTACLSVYFAIALLALLLTHMALLCLASGRWGLVLRNPVTWNSSITFLQCICFGLAIRVTGQALVVAVGNTSSESQARQMCAVRTWFGHVGSVFIIGPIIAKFTGIHHALKKKHRRMRGFDWKTKMTLRLPRLVWHMFFYILICVALLTVMQVLMNVYYGSKGLLLVHEEEVENHLTCRYDCYDVGNFDDYFVCGIILVILDVYQMVLLIFGIIVGLRVATKRGSPAEARHVLSVLLNLLIVFVISLLCRWFLRGNWRHAILIIVAIYSVWVVGLLVFGPTVKGSLDYYGQIRRAKKEELRRLRDQMKLREFVDVDPTDDSLFELPPPTDVAELPQLEGENDSLRRPLLLEEDSQDPTLEGENDSLRAPDDDDAPDALPQDYLDFLFGTAHSDGEKTLEESSTELLL